MTRRRAFIATAASGGALLTGLAAPAALACSGPARRVGGSPSKAVFDELIGQRFEIDVGAGMRADVRLQAVQGRASRQPIEQFSLVLGGDETVAIDGGTYRLSHPEAGHFQLRLDPSGHDAQGRTYRADFSLLV